jgi:hypothetical protein
LLTDLRLLLWLHWRQLLRTAVYWLRVIGFDPLEDTTSNKLYGVYLVIICGGWFVLMWSLIVHGALGIGERLTDSQLERARSGFESGFPWVVTGLALLFILLALRKTPLKLSVEDLAYIAASPMRRDAIGLMGFAGYTGIGLAITMPLTVLASMMLAHPNSNDEIGLMAYPAILTSIPLVIFTAACAWCIGFWRLRRTNPPRSLWLLPLLLAIVAYAVPGVMTWPGRVLAREVLAEQARNQAFLLLALAVITFAGVIWLGRRINLITVAAELGTTSQLKSLGVLGRFTWRDLSRQMRDRERLAKRPSHLHLPRVNGTSMLVARAGLIFARQPLPFAWAVLRSTALIAAGAGLALIGSSALSWLFWLTFVMMLPSRDILSVYSDDQTNAFLRQFIPADNLTLLAVDASLPFVLICLLGLIGSAVAIVVSGVNPLIVPLILVFAAVMLLSQAAALVRAPGGDPTIASLFFTGFGFGIPLLLAEFTGPGTALLAALTAALLLAWAISTSSRFAAIAMGE